jgi:hypothetical protein
MRVGNLELYWEHPLAQLIHTWKNIIRLTNQEPGGFKYEQNHENKFFKNCRLFIQLRGRQMNMEGCPILFAQSSYSTSFTHTTLPEILKEIITNAKRPFLTTS